MPRNLVIGLVLFYQTFFSLDHSFWAKWVRPHGHCKFHPTCSEYIKIALKKYGLVRGILKGSWRILRCNPWGKGGIDLP
ncbi:membrane protein insertion efficiency factor YidD [Patescibacteria group bacterium]|nr:membrane protein insertion efficiency factor YidD [Patescibacteria group bacterium]MBU1682467.1 membrane protein insertion efficiency factor YidD [Patescibacteria group bacterium]MBU1935361.1 membrane protein insertion efficiency factor YidD [Patescibacteria group bacterium]